MEIQRAHVVVIIAVALTAIVVSALAASLMASQTIPNSGNVTTVGVGVYWNSACTSNVTSISWGVLEPGDTMDVTVYIKNIGTKSVVLNMTTSNWNPASAPDSMTVTWNRESYVLDSGVVIPTILTLIVSQDISGITSFSFDMTITGTEST